MRKAKSNPGTVRFDAKKTNSLDACVRCYNEVELDLHDAEKAGQIKNKCPALFG